MLGAWKLGEQAGEVHLEDKGPGILSGDPQVQGLYVDAVCCPFSPFLFSIVRPLALERQMPCDIHKSFITSNWTYSFIKETSKYYVNTEESKIETRLLESMNQYLSPSKTAEEVGSTCSCIFLCLIFSPWWYVLFHPLLEDLGLDG